MNVISLPTEIFEIIVMYAFIARGIKRGMRMRLVNSTFARAVMQVLFPYQLLDNYNRTSWDPLFKRYIAHRVKCEPATGNQMLRCIATIADELYSKRTPSDRELVTMEAYIDKLSGQACFENLFGKERVLSTDEYDEHRFAAATCTNTLPMIQEIANNKKSLDWKIRHLSVDTPTFGSYRTLVARYGNIKTFEFFLTYGEPVVNAGLRRDLLSAVISAGRTDVYEFIYNFRQKEVPWQFDTDREDFDVLLSGRHTPSLKILRFIEELQKLHPNRYYWYWDWGNSLSWRVIEGQMDTIKHMIEYSIKNAEGSERLVERLTSCVEDASRKGDMALTQYLVQRGASRGKAVNWAVYGGHKELVQSLWDGGQPPIGALSMAAARGDVALVRLFLDAGADANEEWRIYRPPVVRPLVRAIRIESKAIVELLLQRGADLTSSATVEECIRSARKDNLESMLQLLEAHGVNIEMEIPVELPPKVRFHTIRRGGTRRPV